jgi:hypothetical protein
MLTARSSGFSVLTMETKKSVLTTSDEIAAIAAGLGAAAAICAVVLGAVYVTAGPAGPVLALVKVSIPAGLAFLLWIGR